MSRQIKLISRQLCCWPGQGQFGVGMLEDDMILDEFSKRDCIKFIYLEMSSCSGLIENMLEKEFNEEIMQKVNSCDERLEYLELESS